MNIKNWTALLGDCLELMKDIPDGSIDCVITSPPYDNLRTYNWNLQWNFELIAKELFRIIKDWWVCVWVVWDSTIKWSESLTSFKQALFFKEIWFNIHDTMIYRKKNYVPLTHNRYEQEFEYMFVFSKWKVKTFNPIKIPCKYAWTETWWNCSFHKTSSSWLVNVWKKVVNPYKQHGNIFEYITWRSKNWHPAPFPLQLVLDNINTWSNEWETILDPFAGSFTTAIACENTNRKWICMEKDEWYYNIGIERLSK